MEENKQTNENAQSNVQPQVDQNVDPISNAYKVSTEEPKKEKGKKGLIALLIFVIILVIAIAGGLIYYFNFYMKPDQVYKRLVESSIDLYTSQVKELDYTTSKTSLKLDADVDIDNDEINEEVLDLINKTDIQLNTQIDTEAKELIVDLESKHDDEDLLNLQMYSNIDDKKTYMQFTNLLDKYIEVEDMDDEYYSLMEETLESQKMTNDEKLAFEKAMKIVKKELTDTIKSEYCSSQKEDITINGKNVKATKNIIKMNEEQFMMEFTTVIKNLKNNQEFLNCFEEEDEIKESLEDIEESLTEAEINDKSTIEISIYTQGLVAKVVKVSAIVKDEENDETVTMTVTKTEENTYSVEVSTSEDDEILKGTLNVEKKSDEEGTMKFGFNIPDFGSVTLNIEYSQKFDEDIDEIDVEDSVTTDELSQADQQTLMKNLQNSKLYELIESFSESSSSILTGNTTSSNIITNIDDEEDEDETTSLSTKDNEIISYDDKTKITFKIPAGYESRYVSDNYRSLDKDDISIKVSSQYGDKDKYYASLEDNKKYYEEESNYKNVELSDMQTMEVNGKTFYCATFLYEYSGVGSTTKYETKYVWTEISDTYVLDFEIRGSESMTEEELTELLAITVEDNK